MSWGYFIELDLTLPTAAWERLRDVFVDDWPAEPGFFGLKEKGLEQMFLSPEVADWTFGRALDAMGSGEAVATARATGAVTKIRVAALLDKSGETYFARPFASLFLAAKELGGEGTLALINDGTYAGEGGVKLTLTKGTIKRDRVEDCWPHVERLGAEIYAINADAFAKAAPTPKQKKKTTAKKKASAKKRR